MKCPHCGKHIEHLDGIADALSGLNENGEMNWQVVEETMTFTCPECAQEIIGDDVNEVIMKCKE